MYTVQELHIAIDMAYQAINSNRKLSIQPFEKDWLLNETMYQEILNIAVSSKRKGSFEDNRSYIMALESIKTSTPKLPVFVNGDKEVLGLLPSDCLFPISARSGVAIRTLQGVLTTTTKVNDRVAYCVVPFIKPSSVQDFSNIVLKVNDDSDILFDIKEKRLVDNKPLYDVSPVVTVDARFMLVPYIIEKLNNIRGIHVYWEHFSNVRYSDSFIVVIDVNEFNSSKSTISKTTRLFSKDTTSIVITVGNATSNCKFEYLDKTIVLEDSKEYKDLVRCRTISHDEIYSIEDDVYARSSYRSTTSVIENGGVRIFKDNSFAIEYFVLDYYRRPKLINHSTGQSCEIDDTFFINNLINKTALKISARVKDDNYPVIQHESTLLT